MSQADSTVFVDTGGLMQMYRMAVTRLLVPSKLPSPEVGTVAVVGQDVD